MKRTRFLIVAAVLCATATLGACSSDSPSEPTDTSTDIQAPAPDVTPPPVPDGLGDELPPPPDEPPSTVPS